MAALLQLPPAAFFVSSSLSTPSARRLVAPPFVSAAPSSSPFSSLVSVTKLNGNIITPQVEKRSITTHASETDAGKESSDSIEELPLESKLQIIADQKLKMKLAKKLRLRRKRLVRKRQLRKKGRWPPSKMKKNKNV